MKTRYMILSAASIIPLLSGCASYQKTADTKAWSIKPLYNVRHSTETPESFYQLGRYYQGQNRYEQALAAYQKALAIDGTYAEARNGLGVIYATQGRQQEALEQFRLAVKQAPNAAHIYNNLGYALYLSGSYAESVSALDRAVALNPANKAAHTNLALALNKAGDREKAVQVMAAVAQPPSAETLPPVTREVQQVQTAPAPAPVVATATPAPAPQPVLALPKDWGVITQAAHKPVLQEESRIQIVQVESNVSELRERTEVHAQAVPAAKPVQQASVQSKKPDMVIAQTAQKPSPAVELRAPTVAIAAEQSARVTAHTVKPLQQVSVQPKKPDMVVAQAEQKQAPVAEHRVQTASTPSRATEQARETTQAAKPYRIEVSNGNGVTGMARKVAGYLDKEGYARAHLTNQKPFNVASSQVQYRSGYREHAQSLALTLPGHPGIAKADNLRSNISVRVVLGKDMTGNLAYFDQSQDKIRLARY